MSNRGRAGGGKLLQLLQGGGELCESYVRKAKYRVKQGCNVRQVKGGEEDPLCQPGRWQAGLCFAGGESGNEIEQGEAGGRFRLFPFQVLLFVPIILAGGYQGRIEEELKWR